MEKIKIVSDGTPRGTHVFLPSGEELKGCITKISWSITPKGFASAVIAFDGVELDAIGNADLSDG